MICVIFKIFKIQRQKNFLNVKKLVDVTIRHYIYEWMLSKTVNAISWSRSTRILLITPFIIICIRCEKLIDLYDLGIFITQSRRPETVLRRLL